MTTLRQAQCDDTSSGSVFFCQAELVEAPLLKYILRQALYDNLKSTGSV